MHHELKIIQPYFEAVIRGQKKFEIRDNSDRGFQKDDTVELIEVQNHNAFDNRKFSGRTQLITITYVCNYNQPENQVVFAFDLVGDVIDKNGEA